MRPEKSHFPERVNDEQKLPMLRAEIADRGVNSLGNRRYLAEMPRPAKLGGEMA